MDNIQKQLIAKLGEEFSNIFPLQYVSNILDKATGETLTILLTRCNHVFIPFTGDKNVTRAAVPPIMRRKGLYITYITPDSVIITEFFNGNKTEVNNEDWVKDENWGTNITSDNFVPITLPDGSVTAEKLSQEVLDLIGQGFKGNIENHPDGEDLTSIELATIGNTKYKVLKFADRNYTQDGMGYVILRKNKTFAEQVTKSNTIYEIRYNFDLNGATINLPANSVLQFEGGSISNGTINGVNTTIIEDANSIGCVLSGTFTNKGFYADSFRNIVINNIIGSGISKYIENLSSLGLSINFYDKTYIINTPINIASNNIILFGNNSIFHIQISKALNFGTVNYDESGYIADTQCYNNNILIKDIKFISTIADSLSLFVQIFNYDTIKIKNCSFEEFKIEGLYIGGVSKNININQCLFKEDSSTSESKGLSIVSYVVGYREIACDINTYAEIGTRPMYNISDIVIDNCQFYKTRLQLSNTESILVTNTTFSKSSVRSINMSPDVYNVSILNNIFRESNGSTNINAAQSCDNIKISDNLFINNIEVVRSINIYWRVFNCIITNNTFINSGYIATIMVSVNASAFITNNIFNNSQTNGISEIVYSILDPVNKTVEYAKNITEIFPSSIISNNVFVKSRRPVIVIDWNEFAGNPAVSMQPIVYKDNIFKDTTSANIQYLVGRLSKVVISDIDNIYTTNHQYAEVITGNKDNVIFRDKGYRELVVSINMETKVITKISGNNLNIGLSASGSNVIFSTRDSERGGIAFITDLIIGEGCNFNKVDFAIKTNNNYTAIFYNNGVIVPFNNLKGIIQVKLSNNSIIGIGSNYSIGYTYGYDVDSANVDGTLISKVVIN